MIIKEGAEPVWLIKEDLQHGVVSIIETLMPLWVTTFTQRTERRHYTSQLRALTHLQV